MTDTDAAVTTVEFDGCGPLTGTAEHPVFVHHVGWVPLGQLAVGARVACIDRDPSVPTTAVRSLTPAGRAPVFNLQIEEVPEFFANGVLTHNCDAAAWGFHQLTGKTAAVSGRDRARAHFNPWAAEEVEA